MKLISNKYILQVLLYFIVVTILNLDLDSLDISANQILKNIFGAILFGVLMYFFDRIRRTSKDN